MLMSVEELRKAIIEKAKREAESIILKAQAEADKIIEEAKQRKRRLIEEEKHRILQELNPEARRAEALYKARLILAEAKSRIVSEVVNSVMEVLNTLPYDKRLESLKKLVDEAMDEILSSVGKVDTVKVKISGRDKDLANKIKEYIEGKYGVKVVGVETTNVIGGVIIECLDGEVIVDNSYDERIRKALRTILPSMLRG
jgi:V/A-type H+-transporting ATPase subunit E